MTEDMPKAVMMLFWLLSGIIIFGWLIMEYTVLSSFIFALVFYGLPVLVYRKVKKKKTSR
ncbi:MAG: hypothetical protein BMS9Abin25_0157 [Gammaproteobacteria bacterium]|nr:MAG: hypothetical protein BMS9Abin25_0157 [Gammaproteobacteria bacterium]